jgi:hypothetical protein
VLPECHVRACMCACACMRLVACACLLVLVHVRVLASACARRQSCSERVLALVASTRVRSAHLICAVHAGAEGTGCITCWWLV